MTAAEMATVSPRNYPKKHELPQNCQFVDPAGERLHEHQLWPALPSADWAGWMAGWRAGRVYSGLFAADERPELIES